MANNKTPFETDIVRDLAKLINETDLTEIEVEKGDLRIRVARQIHTNVSVAAPQHVGYASVPLAAQATQTIQEPPAKSNDTANALRSPMVGTAYRRSNPETAPFVKVGSIVKEGDKLLLIEAMKTFNDILAPRSGKITHIFVDDKQPVEFGEPLLVIE